MVLLSIHRWSCLTLFPLEYDSLIVKIDLFNNSDAKWDFFLPFFPSRKELKNPFYGICLLGGFVLVSYHCMFDLIALYWFARHAVRFSFEFTGYAGSCRVSNSILYFPIGKFPAKAIVCMKNVIWPTRYNFWNSCLCEAWTLKNGWKLSVTVLTRKDPVGTLSVTI